MTGFYSEVLPYMIEGIGAGFVPGNIQSSDYNEIIRVDNHSALK